ncbi:hypothetical protein XPA_002767 [Xanthoria parietina]
MVFIENRSSHVPSTQLFAIIKQRDLSALSNADAHICSRTTVEAGTLYFKYWTPGDGSSNVG